MRIHSKGIWPITIVLLSLAAVLMLINIFFPVQTSIHYVLYAVAGLFFISVTLFFRHPARTVAIDESHVLSAADGTVVVIEEVFEEEFFKDRRLQVSVFMSPLNVHVNWYPVSGVIKETRYSKGKYYPAYLPKSSKENERQATVIESAFGRSVMMVQIAGMMARRVFTNARVGNYVFQGEEAGIIKFGSRVDLYLPLDATVKVTLHQNVRACKTIIAEFPK